MKTPRFRQLLPIILAVLISSMMAADQAPDESLIFYRKHAAEISALTTRLESFIADDIVKQKGRCEHPPARRYAMRDLDGDKKDDLVMVTAFSLSNGGNHHESQLFVVLSTRPNEVQHVIVGERGWRDVDQFFEKERHLFLHFKVWATSDAQCCPSLTTTEEIILKDGRVALKPFDEIKRKPPG